MACLRATGQMCQHLPKQRTPSTPCSLRSSRLLPSRSSLPLVPQPSLAHRSTAHKPQRQQTRAFPEGIDGFITTVALATGAVGVLAYFLSAPASDDVPAQGESDDNFKWGVMGVIGCIPLVNWTVSILTAARMLPGRRGPAHWMLLPASASSCRALATPLLHKQADACTGMLMSIAPICSTAPLLQAAHLPSLPCPRRGSLVPWTSLASPTLAPAATTSTQRCMPSPC